VVGIKGISSTDLPAVLCRRTGGASGGSSVGGAGSNLSGGSSSALAVLDVEVPAPTPNEHAFDALALVESGQGGVSGAFGAPLVGRPLPLGATLDKATASRQPCSHGNDGRFDPTPRDAPPPVNVHEFRFSKWYTWLFVVVGA
jgi:hypothetical protein